MPTRSQTSIKSLELGHFYAAAFAEGTDALTERFKKVGIYAAAAAVGAEGHSTTFLFDDYHNRPGRKVRPRDIVEQIVEASSGADLVIDYLAREAACTDLAPAVLEQLRKTGQVKDYEGGAWLLDDLTHHEGSGFAMSGDLAHRQPRKMSRIDIRMGIELSDAPNGKISWACPYLAAIWQGLRLGELHDARFDQPYQLGDEVPDWETWEDVPALIQLNPGAEPFARETTHSILPTDFLPVENAVGKILSGLSVAMELNPPMETRTAHSFIDC